LRCDLAGLVDPIVPTEKVEWTTLTEPGSVLLNFMVTGHSPQYVSPTLASPLYLALVPLAM